MVKFSQTITSKLLARKMSLEFVFVSLVDVRLNWRTRVSALPLHSVCPLEYHTVSWDRLSEQESCTWPEYVIYWEETLWKLTVRDDCTAVIKTSHVLIILGCLSSCTSRRISVISYIVPGPQFEILELLYTFYESRDKCCGFLGTWKNVFIEVHSFSVYRLNFPPEIPGKGTIRWVRLQLPFQEPFPLLVMLKESLLPLTQLLDRYQWPLSAMHAAVQAGDKPR